MMRSPYQSPKAAPSRRFLRIPPTELKKKRRKLLFWGAGLLLGYLIYSFVGGDDGLIRIRSLQHETSALRARREILTLANDRVDRNYKDTVYYTLLDER